MSCEHRAKMEHGGERGSWQAKTNEVGMQGSRERGMGEDAQRFSLCSDIYSNALF